MSVPSPVMPDVNLASEAKEAAARFLQASKALSSDHSYWPVRMFASLNLFLWHLEAFEKKEDPVPLFVGAFNRATTFLESAAQSDVCRSLFPATGKEGAITDEAGYEESVYGLFSDVWVDMTDDIYFDETFKFTKERLEKNGVDPQTLFKDKVVLDGGCGSGKFSAAIARFGAAQVIGLDLGGKGLEFARKQAEKAPYGKNLEYAHGSLLDIPRKDASVDMVWSNGVIHHTLDYEKCISEFARIIKPGGTLFLYVNGRFGLFELLQDTLRLANADIPRHLFQHFIKSLGVNSGRLYWLMDCLYAPYEYKPRDEVIALLEKHGFSDIRQLTRGVAIDQIEQVSAGLPYAEVKYGEAQLKFLATKS